MTPARFVRRKILLSLGLSALLAAIVFWQLVDGGRRTTAFIEAPAARPATATEIPQPADLIAGRTAAPEVERSFAAAPGAEPLQDAMVAFDRWGAAFLKVAPEQRAAMAEEGVKLAGARRPEFRNLVVNDPREALARAVPMVVRQQLPPAVVAQLEERVNRRADVRVYQGTPVPGDALPAKTLTHRIAAFRDGTAYSAHVFGKRALDLIGTRNDAINGVAIGNDLAVAEEPVRQLEPGETPDPAKRVVTSCPVSGKTVIAADQAQEPIPADATVVETPEEVVHLCGGYHRETYTSTLYGEGASGGPTQLTGILPAAPTPAIGMVKVLFIPMTFADQNAVPTPEAGCYELMRNVGDYYAKASYGKLTTLTTVTPPIKLPRDEAWYVQKDTSNGGTVDGLGLEMAHAREEAKRLGFDYQDYDCTVLRLNGGPRVVGGWGGGSTVWIYSDNIGVTAHEIGHSFGLSHANFWDTAGTSAIGAGTNAEYGDQYDVMGGGSVPTDHYNAQAKNQIKWLPNDFLLDVTQSGTYRVYAFDQPILDPQNRYALRIVKDSQRVYWGEVRQAYNGSTSRPWADKGMLLGWRFPNGSGGNIQLIDTTPGSPFAKDDAAISLGRTFSDYESGIHITTTNVSSTTPKYVDVVVNLGAFPGNQDPTLALAASAEVVPVGATVTFTATATDPDGDQLAYSWQHFGDLNVKIVSPNAPTITRTFSTAGTYVVACTASDMKGGSTTRTKLITVGNGNGRFTISGRVTASGVGLADVIVNANGSNAVITDSDGYYTIPNLTATTYSMTPLLYGFSFSETFNNNVIVGPSFAGANFDADAAAFVSLTASIPTAQEPGTGTAMVVGKFTLARTGDLSQPLAVNVNTASGTATKGTDFTFTPDYVSGSQGFSTFTIPAGAATLDIVVTPLSDTAVEAPETVVLQLGPGNGYLVASASQATVTITDDPADTTLPQVSVAVVTPSTVENSAAPAVLSFTRSGATTNPLTVSYSVSGTAVAGSDYAALPGSLVIPAGASTALLNVFPIDDTSVESVETVIVNVTTSAAYLIQSGAGSGTLSIIDDDVPTVTVIATDPNAAEVDLSVPGAQPDTGTFLISRTGDTSQSLTVYYAMSGPTTGEMALHGVDYEALPGVVVIPAGASAATVTIIPRWDGIGEGPEYVTLNLGAGPTNYKLGTANSATVTIADAPGNLPTVEVIGFTTPAEPSTNGAFRFTVRAPSATPIVVNYTISGTATAGSDYTIAGLNNTTLQGSVTITPNVNTSVSQNLVVTVINDAIAEELENLTLTITPGATYQTFGPTSSATLWLRDDDQPTVFADAHLTNYPPSVAETTTSAAFYLSRTGSTASDLTVNYTMGGTATNGVDYDNGTLNAPLSGVVTIPAGSSGVDVTFRPFNDTIFEGTETIVLSLAPGAYGRGPDATIYLTDNETSAQTVAFANNSATVAENAGTVNVPVTLATAATSPVSVEYVVDSGTRASATTTNNLETLPFWVRAVRTGTSFTCFQSNDGVTWTQRGSAVTMAIPTTPYLAGLVVTSGQSSVSSTAVFDNVSISGLSAGGSSGAATSGDVSIYTPAGSDSQAAGVYTISAGGGGINSGSTSDAFRFVSFPITSSANCTITARVVSLSGSATLSRAGVMFRETNASGARYAASLAQAGGIFLQGSRLTTSASSTQTSFSTIVRPWWVRLQRAGSTFIASQSPDGAAWVQVGTSQTFALPPETLAGLAVSARNDGVLSTATFDNVTLTGAPVLVGRTIGFVNAQGTDSLTNGVYTVNGSGAQIGSTEDECHFVAAPVVGDFTLTARVLAQTGGATNAQAGVMIRENAGYRSRSLYLGSVANAGTEFIARNSSLTTSFGAGVDYSLASGVLTFAVGEQTKNITLAINNDALPEPEENVMLLLRNASGAVLGAQTQFALTIVDDDAPPTLPSVGFAMTSSSAVENAGSAALMVVLSGPAANEVTVNYAVSDGTATPDVDYSLPAGTLTFAPGETVKTINVALLDDNLAEPAESVVVTLASPSGAVLGSLNQHIFTIVDDEFPTVTIVATDASAAESGDPGVFTITRNGSTAAALNVKFARTGTATSGSDFTAIATPGTLTIPAGQTSATITVQPLEDTLNEGNETVILTLTADAAYTLGASTSATVTIADNDRSTVTIVANDPVASETPGDPGQFTITRTAPLTGGLTVALSVSGTATSGSDYTALPSTVTIPAGQSSQTVNVLPIDDAITEGTEYVTLSIGSGSYDIGTPSFANVSIADNDLPPTLYITEPAGQGTVVPSGQGVVVSAFVSDDGAPQPVTVKWTQVSGPGTATFENSTAISSGVTFSADGTYGLKITATDGQFTVTDQVTIVVGATIAPADWISADLSPSVSVRGQTGRIGGTYSVTGTGVGYATTADAAQVNFRQVSGDGGIVARLVSVSSGGSPLAGVTIRDTLYRGAKRAVLGWTATGFQFRSRTTVNASDANTPATAPALPVWLKLERVGNVFTASSAPDSGGSAGAWSVIGATTIAMDSDALFGLTTTSNDATTSRTASFDNVTLTPTPSGATLLSEDCGSGNPTAGSYAFANGTHTIAGSGSIDAGGYFAGQQYFGDLVVTAKLTSATSGATSAHCGIMIRESEDNGGYVFLGRIPTSSFNGFFWRTLANGGTGGVPSFTQTTRWMRLVRDGTSITAFHAADVAGSPGTWVQLGQPQTVIMSAPVIVGLTADNAGGVGLNTCTFTNFTVVPLNTAPQVNPGNVAANAQSPIALDATVSDDGFPAPPLVGTLWSLRAGAGSVTFGNANAIDTSVTLSIGGSYTLRLQASDGNVRTFRDLTFTGVTTALEAWRAAQWSSTGGLNDPNSRPDADPDADGLANLIEFSMGTPPKIANALPAMTDVETIGADRFLRLNVPKNAAASGVQFEVQAANSPGDSAAWSSSGLIIEENTATSLKVRDSVPFGSVPARFLRLRVTGP